MGAWRSSVEGICSTQPPLLEGRTAVLLILAIILLIIAIAGGAIIHPLIFALAIVALVLFFMGR